MIIVYSTLITRVIPCQCSHPFDKSQLTICSQSVRALAAEDDLTSPMEPKGLSFVILCWVLRAISFVMLTESLRSGVPVASMCCLVLFYAALLYSCLQRPWATPWPPIGPVLGDAALMVLGYGLFCEGLRISGAMRSALTKMLCLTLIRGNERVVVREMRVRVRMTIRMRMRIARMHVWEVGQNAHRTLPNVLQPPMGIDNTVLHMANYRYCQCFHRPVLNPGID